MIRAVHWFTVKFQKTMHSEITNVLSKGDNDKNSPCVNTEFNFIY